MTPSPTTATPLDIANAARRALHGYRDALHRVRDEPSLLPEAAHALISERRTDAVVALVDLANVVGDASVGTAFGERERISDYCSQKARLIQLGAVGVREVDDASLLVARVIAGLQLLEEAHAGKESAS